ncbi:muscarinic acetylcholine receptor M3-like [Amphiura filiformis]|uniref:muscarinic acetylcholine receptor M3-like n=1 Tax=Amphiura filiformis TaxID=82378 RepID=UPI003B21763B
MDVPKTLDYVSAYNAIVFQHETNDTNQTNVTDRLDIHLSTQAITIAVFSGFFNTITLLGNLLVVYAFCTTPKLHTYTNYYVLSLAVSDIIAGGFTMPIYSVYWVLGYWPFSDAFCDAYLYINHVFIHISILVIVSIAFDRWQALVMPLQHLSKRTLKHALSLISLSYIIPFLVWLPGCLLWPYMHGGRTIHSEQCYPQYVSDSLVFSCFAPIILFWFPLFVATILYWRIIIVIRRAKMLKNKRKYTVTMESLSRSSRLSQRARTELENGINHTKERNASISLQGDNFEVNEGFTDDVTPTVNTRKRTVTAEKVKRAIEKLRRENVLATNTLTLVFIAMVLASVPWSALVPAYSACGDCIPLALYQVGTGDGGGEHHDT